MSLTWLNEDMIIVAQDKECKKDTIQIDRTYYDSARYVCILCTCPEIGAARNLISCRILRITTTFSSKTRHRVIASVHCDLCETMLFKIQGRTFLLKFLRN